MTRVTPKFLYGFIIRRNHHPRVLHRILTIRSTEYKPLESSTQVRRQSPGFWGADHPIIDSPDAPAMQPQSRVSRQRDQMCQCQPLHDEHLAAFLAQERQRYPRLAKTSKYRK
ncbi:hypothetical protein VN97_g12310 [Penicillium thymicola]|uniref:Uncharacterized protein n=1 Tax=Penicillium thymicola TaxID=293382 RepID=A0AAI9X288_PENTH|nr:hypothetical protein VN97_g12310 [Penicillium thymicola]